MEFAIGVITSIGNALGIGGGSASAGTAAAGAASAGSGLLSATGFASTVASILSGGATIAGAMAAKRAGKNEAFNAELQARDIDFDIRGEQLQGMERRNSLKRSLLQALGERDVAYAASGVDLSFGTPAIAREEASRDAERTLSIDQATEDFRIARLRERQQNLRLMALEARRGGLAKAAGLLLEGGASLLRRG